MDPGERYKLQFVHLVPGFLRDPCVFPKFLCTYVAELGLGRSYSHRNGRPLGKIMLVEGVGGGMGGKIKLAGLHTVKSDVATLRGRLLFPWLTVTRTT